MKLKISRNALGNDAVRHSLEEKESSVEIAVEKNVQALVVLEVDSSVESAVIQSTVCDYAELAIVCVQSPLSTNQKISQLNTVGAGAVLHCQNVTLGSNVEHAVVSNITGAHALSSVDWIAYAHCKEQQNISARNVFCASNGAGEITIKAVAEDTAHIVCNGKIDIESGGGGTDTYLTEDVLMLDSHCIVDAIPALEIKTNDVKASHSATVSKVTDADLFYFGARGIPEKKARVMYVLGFLGEIIQRIPDSKTGDRVRVALSEKYT
jgi:Fe-S cluster assembly protein SufB